MIKLNGINTVNLDKNLTCDSSPEITINGAYITMQIDKKSMVIIRDIKYSNWYDEKHRAVMDAISNLECELEELIKGYL